MLFLMFSSVSKFENSTYSGDLNTLHQNYGQILNLDNLLALPFEYWTHGSGSRLIYAFLSNSLKIRQLLDIQMEKCLKSGLPSEN